MACSKRERSEEDTPRTGGFVEQCLVDWMRQCRGAPALELHDDADAIWVLHPGAAWGNAATRLRFSASSLSRRLDRIIARYQDHGRGLGFWVSRQATPPGLTAELTRRGLRCRKHFPGMFCDLTRKMANLPVPPGVKIAPVEDPSVFLRQPHPFWGNITTPLRRFELARLAHAVSRRPQRAWEFAAILNDQVVGAATLCLGNKCAGAWEIGVRSSHRRRGIGAALVAHLCSFAQDQGARGVALIASGMGESVYRRVGFEVVTRISYWYCNITRYRFRG